MVAANKISSKWPAVKRPPRHCNLLVLVVVLLVLVPVVLATATYWLVVVEVVHFRHNYRHDDDDSDVDVDGHHYSHRATTTRSTRVSKLLFAWLCSTLMPKDLPVPRGFAGRQQQQ